MPLLSLGLCHSLASARSHQALPKPRLLPRSACQSPFSPLPTTPNLHSAVQLHPWIRTHAPSLAPVLENCVIAGLRMRPLWHRQGLQLWTDDSTLRILLNPPSPTADLFSCALASAFSMPPCTLSTGILQPPPNHSCISPGGPPSSIWRSVAA